MTQYQVVERNGWSYVEPPAENYSGPWRYRWEAQDVSSGGNGMDEQSSHTDILLRLRDGLAIWQYPDSRYELCKLAAAEIERLRAELEQAQRSRDAWIDANAERR